MPLENQASLLFERSTLLLQWQSQWKNAFSGRIASVQAFSVPRQPYLECFPHKRHQFWTHIISLRGFGLSFENAETHSDLNKSFRH